MTLLAGIRKVLAKNRIVKPIWNTEVNYGLVGGGVGARPISTERQVGNVIRTFVLNASNKVSRVYWYSWDLLAMSNTPMVLTDRITLTPAGQAFNTSRSWLLGARPAGCTRAKTNTWTCTFTTASTTRRVVWNPSQSVDREGAAAHQLGHVLEQRTAHRARRQQDPGRRDPGDDQLSALTARPAALSTLPG